MKTVELNASAQRFLIEPLKRYEIKELKASIYANSDEDFEAKKAKLLNRNNRFNTGGVDGKVKLIKGF